MRPLGYLKKDTVLLYIYEYKSPFDGFHYFIQPIDKEKASVIVEIDRNQF